jgi:hypothetical protein
VVHVNGEGAPRCGNSGDAQGIVELASATVPHKTDRTETQVAPIRAALFGSDQCRAEGCTVRAASPILETCRRLTQAGYDPDRPLHCYRGDILALRVRSIGEGAALTVKTAGNGSPIYAVLKGAAGSPIDWRDGRATTLAAGAQT